MQIRGSSYRFFIGCNSMRIEKELSSDQLSSDQTVGF